MCLINEPDNDVGVVFLLAELNFAFYTFFLSVTL